MKQTTEVTMFDSKLLKSVGEFIEVEDLKQVLDDNPDEVFTIVYYDGDTYKTCSSTDRIAKSIIKDATSVRMTSENKVFFKNTIKEIH